MNDINNVLIPANLDGIISNNRELVELRLSSDMEIDAIARKITTTAREKDEIDDWRLVTLLDKKNNWAQIMLLGNSREKDHPWITSPILSIDIPQCVVFTRSGSIYRLGTRGIEEPSKEQIICLCAALHSWGMGKFLGVPHFVY